HTCGDGADADLGDQLHMHAGLRVGVLQVVDQLLQVLDRVDVVVRRRRDQPDSRRRVPHVGNPRVHLAARELAAITGFGALRYLDLQVGAVGQVVRRDADPAGSHLLDRAAPPVAVLVTLEAADVLAALTAVRATAEAVHCDRERLVRLGGDRPVAHRARREPLDDLAGRLDLLERHRRSVAGPRPRASSPRSDAIRSDWSSTRFVYSLKMSYCPVRVACCSLNTVSGLNKWYS